MTRRWLCLSAMALGCVLAISSCGVGTSNATHDPAHLDAASWPVPRFPVVVQPGRRYLVDAEGRPFLIQGDAAWSLIAQLRREDVERYLQDRKSRGFNTLLVNLVEHKFARQAPRNAYGDAPFRVPGDFSTPNAPYFDYADWVIGRAESYGFLVLLVPAYMGNGGGDEGWYQEMSRNGPDALRAYGRYVAERFKGHRNIVWVQGGDYNPPNRDLTRALVQGIRDVDPHGIQTAHGSPESSALDYWKTDPWLQVDTLYTYGPVHLAAERAYANPRKLPFFLIESHYENEYQTTPWLLRTQAYQALLNGACGQVFGNNPVWHYDGPGLFDAPQGWRASLNSAGAWSMMYVRRLFDGLAWWTLEPSLDDSVLVRWRRAGQKRAVAARARDGRFALIYVPTFRPVTFDTSSLRGPHVRVQWYDPTAGTYSEAFDEPLPVGARRTLLTPKNAEGSWDAILVLTSVP